jgi:TRAP-type uncharacterized transport system substrate-binding protein
LARKDNNITSFYDLKNKNIAIIDNDINSSKIISLLLKDSKMFKINKTNIIKITTLDNIDTLFNTKQIDACFGFFKHPSEKLKNIIQKNNLQILPLWDFSTAKYMVYNNPYFVWDIIYKNTYNNADHIKTFGLVDVIIVEQKVHDDLVYQMTKAIVKKNISRLDGFDYDLLHKGAYSVYEWSDQNR